MATKPDITWPAARVVDDEYVVVGFPVTADALVALPAGAGIVVTADVIVSAPCANATYRTKMANSRRSKIVTTGDILDRFLPLVVS
jgi:hypothetical protein